MLKQRLLTALLLVPLVVWGVLATSNAIFTLLYGLVIMLVGFEWSRLCGLKKPTVQAGYLLLLFVTMTVTGLISAVAHQAFLLLLHAVTLLWLLLTLVLLLWRNPLLRESSRQPLVLLLGLVLLPLAWQALAQLHAQPEDGPALTLALLVLIWLADSAAYFGGKRFGRIKLAPAVSPNKTYEGLASAMLAAVLWALVVSALALGPGLVVLIGVALLTTLVSVTGDLFESLVKRRAGAKDSGTLLPGHGGVWDRLDSLLSAAPVFLSLLLLLGMQR